MIHKVIVSNKIGAMLLFPIALLIFQLPFLLQEEQHGGINVSVFSDALKYLADNNQIILKIMRVIIILLSGFILHRFLARLDVQRDRGHHALYWFIMFNSFFLSAELDLSIPLANLFLILSMNRTLSVYRDKKSYGVAFDSGFFIGCAVLFNPFYIVLIFFTLVGLTTLKTLNYREVIMVFVGLLVPLFLTSFIIYFFDLEFSNFFKQLILNSENIPELGINKIDNLGSLKIFANVLTIIVLVYSVLKLIQIANKENTRRSKVIQLIFILTIIMGVIRLISRTYGMEVPSVVILSVPLSMMMIHFFSGKKRQWIPISLFYLWFIVCSTNYILESI